MSLRNVKLSNRGAFFLGTIEDIGFFKWLFLTCNAKWHALLKNQQVLSLNPCPCKHASNGAEKCQRSDWHTEWTEHMVYIGLREGGFGLLRGHLVLNKWAHIQMRTFSTIQMSHCKWVGFWMRTKHWVQMSRNNIYPAVDNRIKLFSNLSKEKTFFIKQECPGGCLKPGSSLYLLIFRPQQCLGPRGNGGYYVLLGSEHAVT